MKKRPLGATGYAVGELGYGAWGIGGAMWLGSDDAQGGEALRAALDQGVTFFDTALAYGDGHSEELIGKVLKAELKDGRALLATKVPPGNLEWPADANKPLSAVFPPKHITKSTERSLKNLRVDAIPVQQLHVWHDTWLAEQRRQSGQTEPPQKERTGGRNQRTRSDH